MRKLLFIGIIIVGIAIVSGCLGGDKTTDTKTASETDINSVDSSVNIPSSSDGDVGGVLATGEQDESGSAEEYVEAYKENAIALKEKAPRSITATVSQIKKPDEFIGTVIAESSVYGGETEYRIKDIKISEDNIIIWVDFYGKKENKINFFDVEIFTRDYRSVQFKLMVNQDVESMRDIKYELVNRDKVRFAPMLKNLQYLAIAKRSI